MALEQTLSQYCAIARDEMQVKEQCSEQTSELTEELAQCKTVLAQFLQQQNQTCVPVTVQTDEGERTLYLRSMVKTTYKTVNEDAFKRVIERVPSPEDLQDVYDQLESPNANFIDVYASWIFNTLYEQNTTQRTAFEVSDKKARGTAKNPVVSVPPTVTDALDRWMLATHNLRRLKTFKKTKIEALAQEKKTVEPQIEAFLAARPADKQEQKVTMTLHGEAKPFLLRRVVEKRSPALTLNKSKPLILHSVEKVVTTIQPQLLQKPFERKDVSTVLGNSMVLNLLCAEFRTQFEAYRQTNVNVTTHVGLYDKNQPRNKRKAEEPGASDEESE